MKLASLVSAFRLETNVAPQSAIVAAPSERARVMPFSVIRYCIAKRPGSPRCARRPSDRGPRDCLGRSRSFASLSSARYELSHVRHVLFWGVPEMRRRLSVPARGSKRLTCFDTTRMFVVSIALATTARR